MKNLLLFFFTFLEDRRFPKVVKVNHYGPKKCPVFLTLKRGEIKKNMHKKIGRKVKNLAWVHLVYV